MFAAPSFAGSGPDVTVPLLSGAPTIDGVQGAPEWDGASATAVNFGPGLDGTLYVGRDATNLYVALKVNDANGTTPTSSVYFDNNDDGTRAVGDDLWDLTPAGVARDWFVSDVSPGGFSVNEDALAGGTNDTTAAQTYANGVYFVEYKHPLCSADTAHDICATVPSRLGIDVVYAGNGASGAAWPSGIIDPGGWANLVIPAAPPPAPTIALANGDGRESLSFRKTFYELFYNANVPGSFRLSVPANDDPAGITSASFPSTLFDAVNTSQPAVGWGSGNPNDTPLDKTYTFAQGAAQPTSIAVTSTDANGLTGPARTIGFQPDGTPPTGSFTCQPIGCTNPNGPVRVTVHVSDNLSGIREIDYRTDGGAPLDGGTQIANGGSFLVTAPGAQIVIGAIDNVGNQDAAVASGPASGAPAPPTEVWNFATDFQGQSNPGPDLYGNDNVWSYGELPVASEHDLGTSTLYTSFSQTPGTPNQCWVSSAPESGTTVPDACVVTGTAPPGPSVDPGAARDTFVSWRSPITGDVSVTGGFGDRATGCGDGVSWFVDKNGTTLTSGSFGDGGQSAFGRALALVSVAAGDSLTFAVGPGANGDFSCDATAAAITITQLAPSTGGGTSPQPGPSYTVNTAQDVTDATGCTVANCSLREAILAADAAGVPATIGFAILAGPQTIGLNGALPPVTVPTTIDGTTQPGVVGGPGITLDGAAMAQVGDAPPDALTLATGSAGSVVRGLEIINAAGNALVVGGDGDQIVQNVLGLNGLEISFGNGRNGVLVQGANGVQISGNTVSSNAAAGIRVTGGSTGTSITGNTITVNSLSGVQIDSDSPNTRVGGTARGDANRIASNGGPGVSVSSTGNPILGNAITANQGGGIDLGTTGNQLQAPPLLAAARRSGGTVTVIGKFLSAPGTYRFEYFLNTACTARGVPREGAVFVGTSRVTVNGGGEAAVNAALDFSNTPTDAGTIVTATATNLKTQNTSPFSACVGITAGGTATSATLSFTSSSRTTLPGAFAVPLSAIPPTAFGNTTTDSSGNTASAPLGAIPLGAIPLGAIPLGAIPLGAIPLGAIGFTPQVLTADGLGGVPLNTIPLKPPLSWEQELQGTALAGLPIQTLTLRDVLALSPLPANLQPGATNPIGLKDMDLSLSPLGAIPLGAIALGSTPLGAIPIGGSGATNADNWCAQIHSLPGFAGYDCSNIGSQTVMGVALQGVPLGAIPLGAIPLGAIPLGAIPLGAIPLGAIDLADSPLGAIPLGAIDFSNAPKLGQIPLSAFDLSTSPLGSIQVGSLPVPSAVVTCSCGGETLAQAAGGGGLKSTATLGDLGAYGDATLVALASYLQAHPDIVLTDVVPGLPATATFRDLLIALMGGTPPSWESFPLAGLQAFAGAPGAQGGLVTYSASFSIQGTGGGAIATLDVATPNGAFYVPGSAVLTDTTPTTPTTTPLADPTAGGGLSWTLDSLTYGDNYTLSFKLRPGFQLGNEQATATLSTNGVADQSAQANVVVGDTFESNDTPAAAPAVSPGTLYLSYLANGKDVDYSTLHIDPSTAPAGTRIKIFLSHLSSDADLAVFGPVDPPLRTPPASSIPLGAIPAGDQTVALGQASQQLAPDTAQDLPFGALPPGDQLLGVSDNRGTGNEEVDITSTGLTGDLIIQVSSYDGHPSTDPYMIRVEEDQPPALPPCMQQAPTGAGQTEAALPTNSSIPSTAQTLILFDEKRLGQYYTPALAHTVYTNLQAYAARSDVNGVIVPVEANTAVANAYQAWDGAMCSPAKANGVVRAIGGLLDSLQAGHPNLKSILIVGADNVIPMGRVVDQTQQANELGFRSNFGFTNNEYVGAIAAGDLLTDDPYADPDPQEFIGGFLYVPKLALGRLVETPQDISRQLTTYIANNGIANPQTKLVTGYDFLTDGSQAVDSALGRTAPTPNLISDTWTADQVRSGLFPSGTQPLIDSLNAHYDQHRALSAQGNTLHDESAPYLFTSTDIASHGTSGVVGRIVFTMGCHAGFSLFDNLNYGPTASSDFALDWPQAYLEGGAIEFMGNTGFGLGDTTTVAYSERLNQLFAQRLNGTMTVGQALEFAKEEYVGDLGVVSVYDQKVGNEATLYGIPTYRLGTGTPPAAPAQLPTHVDPATGLTSADFTVAPTFTLHPSTAHGDYYSANDPNGGGVQVTNRRPIEPLTSLDVTEPGATAHGVLLTNLVSHDASTSFHVAFSRVTDDSSLIEPQLQGLVDFPASIQSLAAIATPNGQRQRAVLIAGHFASGPSSAVGTQRLYDTIAGHVLYSGSRDFVRPTVRDVQVFQAGSTVAFAADVSDLDASGAPGVVKQVIALYLDGSGTWQRANLACANGRCSGGGPLTGTSIDYIVEAVDAAGNVGINANKAATRNVVQPFGSGHISISYGGAPQTAGWFTSSPVTAALTSDDGATFSTSLDGGVYQDGSSVTITGDGIHTLDVLGSDGSAATFVIPVDTTPPTISIFSPVDGSYHLVNEAVKADYACAGPSGLAANGCTGPVPSGANIDVSTPGVKSFTVTARDPVGHVTSKTVTYTVWRTPGDAVVALANKTLGYLGEDPLRARFQLLLANISNAVIAKRPSLACAALDLYIAAVKAAPATSLTAAQKADLVADAGKIKTLIGC